jgi:putative ABC transport system ATP-binding protein
MQASVTIQARELSVAFKETPLFEGLSFSIAAGEHVALTGPSGVGKSTVLRCLLGLVEPASGEITVCGETLDPHSVWRIRSQMAFVPQEADLGQGSAREFLDRPFQYRVNISKSENRQRLPDLLQAVGVDDALLSSEIGSLSGGEKQRIALVSALLLDRPILLLDEVTSALDKESTARVQSLLASLKDKTIIGVVHEEDGMPFATRQICVNKGDS